MAPRDRKALHLMIQLFILGYLAGTWWPSTRAEGLATIILLGYLIHNLFVTRERDREKTSP